MHSTKIDTTTRDGLTVTITPAPPLPSSSTRLRHMTVARGGAHFSRDELIELAHLIRDVYRAHRAVLDALNGRARVRWIDPLCSFGSASKYFGALRSALDEDWCGAGFAPVVDDDDGHRLVSPFFGGW